MRTRPALKNGVDVAIVAISALSLLIFLGGGVFTISRAELVNPISALDDVLLISPLAAIFLIVLPIAYSLIILITLARLLNINLRQITTRPGPLTVVLAILFLNRSDTETDTSRLGLFLAGLASVILLVLPVMVSTRYSTSGLYIILFLMLTVPLVLLHAFYLPIVQDKIRAYQPKVGGYEPYLDVVSGTLVGARPRLPNQDNQPFYVGRSNDCQLVLFDDHTVQDFHVCFYFFNSQPFLQNYAPVIVNGQPLPQGIYPLKPNMQIQIGQSLIVYKV